VNMSNGRQVISKSFHDSSALRQCYPPPPKIPFCLSVCRAGQLGMQQLTPAVDSSSGSNGGSSQVLLGLEDTDAALQRQEDLQVRGRGGLSGFVSCPCEGGGGGDGEALCTTMQGPVENSRTAGTQRRDKSMSTSC
jgi:hypothetical protein